MRLAARDALLRTANLMVAEFELNSSSCVDTHATIPHGRENVPRVAESIDKPVAVLRMETRFLCREKGFPQTPSRAAVDPD
jgi:hypothetical protein